MSLDKNLDDAFRIQQDINASIAQDPQVIRRFLDPASGFIRKQLFDESVDKTHTTCTAFCLFYLENADLLPKNTRGVPFPVLTEGETQRAITVLGTAMSERHRTRKNGGMRTRHAS